MAKGVLVGEPMIANELYRLGDMAYESPRLAFLSFVIVVSVWSAMTFYMIINKAMSIINEAMSIFWVRPPVRPPVPPPAAPPPAAPPVPPPPVQPPQPAAVVRPPGQGPEMVENGKQTPVNEMMTINTIREELMKMGLRTDGSKGELLKRGFDHIKRMNDMV